MIENGTAQDFRNAFKIFPEWWDCKHYWNREITEIKGERVKNNFYESSGINKINTLITGGEGECTSYVEQLQL